MRNFKRMDNINIVPFIDIMLVLLVIVLTSATFIAQGKIPIAIPKAQGSDKITQPLKNVEITIDAQGQYYLDKTPMDLETIQNEIAKTPKETPILLRGDQKSTFEKFVALVGVLSSTGHENVDVQVEQSQ